MVPAAVGVGRACVRVVLVCRAVEVFSVTILIILRCEAFVTRPGCYHGAVHGEMLVGQQGPYIRMVQQFLHEAVENIAGLQSLAILCKRRRVPHRVVRRKPDEPAVQKIVVQLLHQLPFTPHAVKHLQPPRAQQLFGRDRRAPRRCIPLAEIAGQSAQHLAHQLAYFT